MLILENIALAFQALLANKMRSVLTMLGIIIGIGSVIAIVTIGNSLTNSITSSMETMGANDITIGLKQKETAEETTESGMTFQGPRRRRTPTEDDYFSHEMVEDFRAYFKDEIKDISIILNLGSGEVDRGTGYAYVEVSGVNDGYFVSADVEIIAGQGLSAVAQEKGKGVALVSDYFVDNLYAGDAQAAIGQVAEVTIGRDFYEYTIVGVYQYKANAMMTLSKVDTPTPMYVPLKNVQKHSHLIDKYPEFTAITATDVETDAFMGRIRRFFDKYYHGNRYFEVSTFSFESIVSALTDILSKVSIAISVIAGISLLVGGIGVMNIMMVSVSERTSEIGIRKALGATNGSIRLQFIVEAMVMCLVGGVLGVIIGILGGALGAKALGYAASPSLSSVVISILFSLAIGVFFGFYPANKAARMNPIDALRYE